MKKSILWGTQLYPTMDSIIAKTNKENDLGIFLGYTRKNADLIHVVKHGTKNSRIYHVDYWTINPNGWKG